MNKEELKKLDKQALHNQIEAFRKEYFTLKLNASTDHVKDYSQFKKLRKNIARSLALLSKNNI